MKKSDCGYAVLKNRMAKSLPDRGYSETIEKILDEGKLQDLMNKVIVKLRRGEPWSLDNVVSISTLNHHTTKQRRNSLVIIRTILMKYGDLVEKEFMSRYGPNIYFELIIDSDAEGPFSHYIYSLTYEQWETTVTERKD